MEKKEFENILEAREYKWIVVVNKLEELKDSTFDGLKKYIEEKVKPSYFCFCFEEGAENKRLHVHIYMCFKNARYGSAMKKYFGRTCHLEIPRGNNQQNRDYIFKENLSEKNKGKEDTKIEGMQYESADTPPPDVQGKRNDLATLYNMIREGYTNTEIYTTNPSFIKFSYMIDKVRTEYLEEKYRKDRRELEVVYVTGKTGTGKTRTVMDTFGYDKVYRVTDYKHAFDSYKQEDVIVFEEFRSSLAIEQMLNFLDCYPVMLPARYCNKVACYHKVFICTNWDLEEQYKEIQANYPETWNAFLRRIDKIKIYNDTDDIEEYNSVEEYLHRNDMKDVFDISDNGIEEIDLFNFI